MLSPAFSLCLWRSASYHTPRHLSFLPHSAPPFSASVGTPSERAKASETFNVNASSDPALWVDNAMLPFVGKTLRMTGIQIIKRNAFNSLIELAVKTGTVLWVRLPHPPHSTSSCEHILCLSPHAFAHLLRSHHSLLRVRSTLKRIRLPPISLASLADIRGRISWHSERLRRAHQWQVHRPRPQCCLGYPYLVA